LAKKGLRYAHDPMPPEDRDIRIIHEGLKKSVLAADEGKGKLDGKWMLMVRWATSILATKS
jgi:hypothetical protein